MRTRRTVALGLSAVMAVSVLSGCGSSSSSTTADTKGESNASAQKAPQSRSYFTGGDPLQRIWVQNRYVKLLIK